MNIAQAHLKVGIHNLILALIVFVILNEYRSYVIF